MITLSVIQKVNLEGIDHHLSVLCPTPIFRASKGSGIDKMFSKHAAESIKCVYNTC